MKRTMKCVRLSLSMCLFLYSFMTVCLYLSLSLLPSSPTPLLSLLSSFPPLQSPSLIPSLLPPHLPYLLPSHPPLPSFLSSFPPPLLSLSFLPLLPLSFPLVFSPSCSFTPSLLMIPKHETNLSYCSPHGTFLY